MQLARLGRSYICQEKVENVSLSAGLHKLESISQAELEALGVGLVVQTAKLIPKLVYFLPKILEFLVKQIAV